MNTRTPNSQPVTEIPGFTPERSESARYGKETVGKGLLVINADDWGRDNHTTDRIHQCIRRRTVSSASAMVFMVDSERAATLARESGIDSGLHLNFTTPYSAKHCSERVTERQRELIAYLRRHPVARFVFHPGLARSFEYVVKSQLDEYNRIYGTQPDRIDGHHHMHLCANVLVQRLLPGGILVRRNFSFRPGEKRLLNRLYRKAVDHRLASRHPLVDFLFSLPPLEPFSRLERIVSIARESVVEVETHPVNEDEYSFLMGERVLRWTREVPIAPRFAAVHRGNREGQNKA